MNTKALSIAYLCSVLLLLSCSGAKFSKMANCQNSGIVCQKECEGSQCIESYNQEYTVGSGKVDILFVVDNSGSMAPEQEKMATRFSNFLSKIDSLDYRIGITTTDVSASANDFKRQSIFRLPLSAPEIYGPAGFFNDGALIPFTMVGGASSPLFLTPDANLQGLQNSLFLNTIQRQETKRCDANGYKQEYCPSSDERAIYALNRVFDRYQDSFFRKNSHLAVVILSDEDERGATQDLGGGVVQATNPLSVFNDYANYDLPESFIWRYKQKFPGQTLAVHSIIINPGTSEGADCKRSQTTPILDGQYGHMYKKFSLMTNGHVGSICSSDYGREMGTIGSFVADQLKLIQLACRPKNDAITVEFSPQPTQAIQIKKDFTSSLSKISFEPALPGGTKIRIKYKCDL